MASQSMRTLVPCGSDDNGMKALKTVILMLGWAAASSPTCEASRRPSSQGEKPAGRVTEDGAWLRVLDGLGHGEAVREVNVVAPYHAYQQLWSIVETYT